MISKSKKGYPIIGRKVRVLQDLRNGAEQEIKAGEIVEIYQSFRGYGIKTEDNRHITRVKGYQLSDIPNANN